MTKEKLSIEALKHFHLENKTQLFWSRDLDTIVDENDSPIQTLFLGLNTLWVNYTAEHKRSDFYMLKNDPWFEKIGEATAFSGLRILPGTTHYVLGDKIVDQGHSSGSKRYLDYKEVYPIVFLKVR